MKKNLFYLTAIVCFSFLVSCDDKTDQSTVVKPTEPATTTIDTTQRTNIRIDTSGVGVDSKNTQIQINKNGIKIGTKKVNVDIK